MADTSKLTPKQKRFCHEYVIDLNGTQAAIRSGYSPRTANEQAARLLAKVSVDEYIKELKRQKAKNVDITAERVLQEIAAIAFAKLTDVVSFDANGKVDFKNSDELDDKAKAALASVTYSNSQNGGIRQSAKMHDKIAALTLLCKHLGIAEAKEESDPNPTTGLQWVRLVNPESTDAASQG